MHTAVQVLIPTLNYGKGESIRLLSFYTHYSMSSNLCRESLWIIEGIENKGIWKFRYLGNK